jgi:hypothetical protein
MKMPKANKKNGYNLVFKIGLKLTSNFIWNLGMVLPYLNSIYYKSKLSRDIKYKSKS